MRWTMPIFALALAIALGAISPQPVRQGHAHGNVTQLALPSLAGFSLFGSAEAMTLADIRPQGTCAAPKIAATSSAQNNALLWAASLRGWSEGPTVRAWRNFVAWTKQGWRLAAPCTTTQASPG
jgi:hypothetical protein